MASTLTQSTVSSSRGRLRRGGPPSLKKTIQLYKAQLHRLEAKHEQLLQKREQLNSRGFVVLEELETTSMQESSSRPARHTVAAPARSGNSVPTIQLVEASQPSQLTETEPVKSRHTIQPQKLLVEHPEEYHSDVNSLVSTATNILIESVELRLGFIRDILSKLNILYRDEPKVRTPPELGYGRYEEWLASNQRLLELNAQLFEIERLKFELKQKKTFAKKVLKKKRREDASTGVEEHTGSLFLKGSIQQIQSFMSRFTFETPMEDRTASYLQELLEPRGDRTTLEAQKIQEYVRVCLQNMDTSTDIVVGAHPQSYQQFMNVLCNYIVEKQREVQGEQLPHALVYSTVERHVIPKILPAVMRHVSMQERDAVIQRQCARFGDVTLRQLKVKDKLHSNEVVPFLESITQLSKDCSDQTIDFAVLSMSAPPTVTPHTQLFFLCQQYSLVFLLDLSDNMRTVSNHTHFVKVDSALSALHATLTLLTRPLSAPGSAVCLEPELCVTVMAYCGNSARKVIHVLLQGVYMSSANCSEMLHKIKAAITQLEMSLAIECGLPGTSEEQSDALPSTRLLVGDTGLEGMVKAGSLALQLLPRCALKGLVLLTDGVSGFSSPLSMHNTVNSMRGANVSCWVVHVGGGPHPMDALGHIPDTETLQFMTKACNGCVMDTNKIQEALTRMDDPEHTANVVQQAILFWTFQQGALEERVRGVACDGWEGWEDPFAPIIDRVFTRSTINAPLLCLSGCKIREGFFLKHVHVRDSWLEVCLYYPWQPSVNIYYTITAPWPVTEEIVSLQVCTSYDGPYSFVHDIQCDLNPPVSYSYRQAAIRKFKQALQKFSSSDALLAHFLSFPTTPIYYTLPQSVANGMPLFYFPPNQTKPAASVNISSTGGKVFSSLVNFWRPLCTIDTSQWFRWFHSDKIVLVLQQDSLLPAHLLYPAPSGRYATIQFRLSASHLYNFLKLWSSLALLENHSYIRFLPSSESPSYFCLVRVAQVLPCVVLHVGHIQGTPHSLQSQTVSSLVAALKDLTVSPSERPMGAIGRKRPSLAVKAKPSATVLDKQLQRVIIRHENVVSSSGNALPTLAQVEVYGERPVQMDYLSCSCWVWKVPHTTPTLLLALLRRRLKEGFLLSGSRNGIVSLIAQLTTQQPMLSGRQHLLLQYVIFPFSEHPTLELWVEPQYGNVSATPPGLTYLTGATHTDIANKIHNVDKLLVTSLSTFLYLQNRCQPTFSPTVPPQSCDPACKSCDIVPCHVDICPGSLFASSQAIVLTLTAFSENSTGVFVDLDNCSQLNSKFWTRVNICLSKLAPTQIPTLTNVHTLLTRITSSKALTELTSKCQLRASNKTEWHYFVLSNDDSVVQLYLPDMFYCIGEGEFVLPLVLLDCRLDKLVDPDPSQKDVSSQLPDLYLHCPLSAQLATHMDLGESLENLLFSLNNAHLSSYLDVIHSSLPAGLQVSPCDFLAGLNVCSRASVHVDLTPLLAALCPHCCVYDEEGVVSSPLATPTLAGLLESVVDRQSRRYAVRPVTHGDEEWPCSHLKEETGLAISRSLTDYQFVCVPDCLNHYYWNDRSGLVQEEGPQKVKAPPPTASPASESSTLHRASFTEDNAPLAVTSDPKLEPPSDGSDVSLCSSEEMDIDPLLSSLEDSEEEGHSPPHSPSGHAPLFLNISFTVRNKSTEEVLYLLHDPKAGSHDFKEGSHDIKDIVPLCLKPFHSNLSPDDDYFVSMEMEFMSFKPLTTPQQDKRSEVAEDSEREGLISVDLGPLSSLPQTHQHTANALRQRLEWLVADELVSVSRKATPITQPLMQAVVAHVQMTQSEQCYSRRVPLKFVFGYNHCMSHFLQELEGLQVPDLSVIKTGDYYYLTPRPHPPHQAHLKLTQGFVDKGEGRSMTPPPTSVQSVPRIHRRSSSTGYPRGHAPQPRPLSSQPGTASASADGSQFSLLESASGYEASQSCSLSSLSVEVSQPPSEEKEFWMILRPLPDLVELCLHVRSASPEVNLEELGSLSTHLEEAITLVCHRTNQWFLLRELLETRVCSPYLLSESASEAWVDEVVSKHEGAGSSRGEAREVFRGQEFMCDLQWKRHITPHWRLKGKGAQTALRITRTALDAFSVSNRRDVYVLQDISSTGEESIFYLKIDESLCRVEAEESLDESPTTGEEVPRPDTRATVEGAETLSTVSMQPSISEAIPELEKKVSTSSTDITSSLQLGSSGKPQESLVLQLYGITTPSPDLTERLNHVVQFKIDDAVLESMCTLYTRNQRLRLYPADVQFLQPSITEPSHILSLPLPNWVRQNVEALVFYFLQSFSTITLRPNYTSMDHREHFQVPLELQNAYLSETCDSSHEIHQDHLFLYIRPHYKGRGMAVICVSLVSPEGRIITPIPGIVYPVEEQCPLDLENSGVEELKCDITEIQAEVKGQYSLRLHVWEKGNIGLTEFMDKVVTCFKHTLVDYVLELYLLPLPVATPLKDGEGGRDVSPYLLVDYPIVGEEISRRESYGQDELETVVEEGATYTPPSRKISRDSRRGSGDTRRGSGDTRRGSGDTRRGSGDTRQGPESERRVSGSSRKLSADIPARKVSSDVGQLDHTLEMESITFAPPSDAPRRSRTQTEAIIEQVQEAMHENSWVDQEKLRREKEATEGEERDAHFGNRGVLGKVYERTIPQHLRTATRLKALSVSHYQYSLLGSYSAKVFLSEAAASISHNSPDLAINAFASTSSGEFVHFEPPQNWTKVERHVDTHLHNSTFILIGRNLSQFYESLQPKSRSSKPWLDQTTKLPLQLFQPLDCRKMNKSLSVPLQHMPIAADAFVPRQRLVIAIVTTEQVDVWLYNFSEESSKRVAEKLSRLHQWQSSRTGLLHHLLSQKLGLFQHTQARDLQRSVKLAVKHCSSMKEVDRLFRNNTPVIAEVPTPRSRLQRPVVINESPLLDSSYQSSAPHTPPRISEDPVFNHGHQFKAHHTRQRRDFESQELLGKVFQSWQSRSGLAPVNAATISALKHMARLIHFCSSPILPGRCVTNKAFTDSIKEEVLSLYISYLGSLGFQAITERSSTVNPNKPPPPVATPPTSKLYKCLQRSWVGGIILVELCYQGDNFLVKLYSLESSRLVNQSPITPESQTQFSLECARYKDFIHIHSFLHDFHLRLLLNFLNDNVPTSPGNFDLRQYITLCYNKDPPYFVRNLLKQGELKVATPTVGPRVLYQYLVVHCALFAGQTLELKVGGAHSREDVGLLIDVSAESLGPMTSPQLSRLMEDTQGKYHTRVLVLLQLCENSAPVLRLDYYLLLVHKDDRHPRLIRRSPHLLATHHALPSGDSDSDNEESELNIKVREHRRKMGLGPASTPSQASQLVLNTGLIQEHMVGVKDHLEVVCQDALCHMRRDALWKRLLYGQVRHDPGRLPHNPLDGLSCSDFRELLRLVTLVPLDSVDPRLAPLRKQPRKWFKRLLLPLQVRFSDNIRLYSSDDDSYNAAAIINPEWQDMFLLVQVDRETRLLASVYRHQKEGGVPSKERLLTANQEAERAHIEMIVNFVCSFLWASILDTSPPQPQLNLL